MPSPSAGERYCSNCLHCVRGKDEAGVSVVRCSQGLWRMPHISEQWLARFKYLPVDGETGASVATTCQLFNPDSG